MNPHSWHMNNTPAYRDSKACQRAYGNIMGALHLGPGDRENLYDLIFLLYRVIL